MKYDAAFVLGLRLNPDGSPNDELKLRVAEAAKCYNEGLTEVFVLCGGPTHGTPVSEASVMRRLMLEAGVPDESIRLEDKSQITAENIKNGIEVLGGAQGKRVLVVSSDYHVFRSLLICRRAGLKASGRGAKTPNGPEKRRNRKLERMFTVDVLMGWQDHCQRRPKWAEKLYRLMLGLPKDAPVPGKRMGPPSEEEKHAQ